MWIALAIVAAITNALWTSRSKPIVQDTPPLRMQLQFRLMLSAIFLVPFITSRELPCSAGFWLTVAAVGLLHGTRWVVILHGVTRDYFSTYALFNTAPLFTILLAPSILPERFGLPVWLGVVSIMVGGWLFYRTSRVSAHGLVGAVMTATINILCKRALNDVAPLAFVFLMQASGAAVLAVGYAFARNRQPTAPRWRQEMWRILPLALFTAVGSLSFFYALSFDTATRVTAVVRTNLIFGFLLSYLVLKEKAHWQHKIVGTSFILLGTIAVAL
jgi:drug/metabolite transporter (DMT)-like permease